MQDCSMQKLPLLLLPWRKAANYFVCPVHCWCAAVYTLAVILRMMNEQIPLFHWCQLAMECSWKTVADRLIVLQCSYCCCCCVDLSRNRFSEVPADICNCVSVESLSCYHNVIKSLPVSIVQLHNLVYLNLR